MVEVSRYRNKGGRRGGVEVAEVTDVEEVVEARVFGPYCRLRAEAEVVDVVEVVGVAEVVASPSSGPSRRRGSIPCRRSVGGVVEVVDAGKSSLSVRRR